MEAEIVSQSDTNHDELQKQMTESLTHGYAPSTRSAFGRC